MGNEINDQTMAITSATGAGSESRKLFRSHQTHAITAAAEHYRHDDRGQLILPCGTGKTATAAGIREELGARSTLVLLPSLVLVEQFRKAWAMWRVHPYEALCVCSDNDIGEEEDALGMDALGLWQESSTDPHVVARFLGRPGPKVVFSTYQSLDVVRRATGKAGSSFDLAICDEAHRTAGAGMRLFGNIHHDAHVRARKRLYMTATPRIAASRQPGLPNDVVVYDMDDHAVFGRPFFQMTFRQAIDAKLLADYSVVAVGVADEQVQKWMRESARCTDHGTVREMAMNYALELAMRRHGARRAISYHSRVRSAEEFAARHSLLFGDIFSGHVSGAQAAEKRKDNLKRFAAGQRATLSNVRCLVEGFDLDAVDMVFFCDPKASTIDVIQAAGRALRLDPSRPDKKGLIVLPVFHASESDLADGLADGEFRGVANVLAALSEADEVLKGEIAWHTPGGTRTLAPAQDKPEDEAPAPREESDRIVVTGFDGRLEQAIFDQIVCGLNGNRDDWKVAYRALLLFRGANPNRWPVRGEECPAGTDLWKWCRAQLRADSRGTLPDARRRLLDDCGLLAEARPCWLVQYQRLRSYVATHSGEWPARETEHPAGNRLGAWCASQRRARRDSTLSVDRVQLLDGLGFPWGRSCLGDSAVTSSREESRPEVTVSC